MDVLWNYLAILLMISFFYLFVCVNEHGTGCLPKTKILLWRTLPNVMRGYGRRTCGEKFI